jgi:hypothetical protein
MKLLLGSPPLIFLSGELNTDCRIDDVFRSIRQMHPTVTIQYNDRIEIFGPPDQVLKAIEILFSQEVDVFRGNKYPLVEFLEDTAEFDRKKIRHAARKGKDKVFGEILSKTRGLPACYGSYAIRMVTPTTMRSHMNDSASDLVRCKDCKEGPTCQMSTVIRKIEELKWLRE